MSTEVIEKAEAKLPEQQMKIERPQFRDIEHFIDNIISEGKRKKNKGRDITGEYNGVNFTYNSTKRLTRRDLLGHYKEELARIEAEKEAARIKPFQEKAEKTMEGLEKLDFKNTEALIDWLLGLNENVSQGARIDDKKVSEIFKKNGFEISLKDIFTTIGDIPKNISKGSMILNEKKDGKFIIIDAVNSLRIKGVISPGIMKKMKAWKSKFGSAKVEKDTKVAELKKELNDNKPMVKENKAKVETTKKVEVTEAKKVA